MSDVFFIVASICFVIVSVLLGVLLWKLIDTIDEVNQTIDKAKNITSNISKVVNTVASMGSFVSPVAGTVRKVFKKRKKKHEEDDDE